MTGASGRVLVVDDNRVIRQLIRVNLELEGFEVVTAADGAECLEIVHSVRPDVVTLDVAMPRLDGVRTAGRLRADIRTRHISVVMVSGGTVPEGVGDACLGKPFEPAELVETVRTLVGRYAPVACPHPLPHPHPGADPHPHPHPPGTSCGHPAAASGQ